MLEIRKITAENKSDINLKNDPFRLTGRLLVEACKTYATEHGFKGICTVGQDNNLIACRLYLSAGFKIGGLDTEIYNGTKQAGKADVWFYW